MDIFGGGSIFTLEPEHVKQVLATQFDNYEKGSEFKEAMQDVLGTGVFNSDGDMWKFHRSMTRPFFSKDRISHFNLFERHADELIGLMAQRFRDGYAIDAQDAFSRFTLDSATEFLFGSCVHSLKSGLPYPENANAYSAQSNGVSDAAEEFAKAFSGAQEVLAQRARLGPYWPMWEISKNKAIEPLKIVSAFIDPILAAALEKKNSSPPKTISAEKKEDIDDEETLLDHLVKYTDDKVILKDEILNIMIAGRDTTATTLTFATYLLAMHPDAVVRLRNEILDKVGPSRCPTYEDIREMKYLRAFINETLRLFPAVPFDGRRSKKATTLAPVRPGEKPFYVPAETGVSYSVFLMHRRTDLWGPDASEFDPDRFLDERLHKYLTPNPFIFVPFNAGPRICLGQQFAYNETSFMLVRLLQTFDRFELDPTAQPPETIPPPSWKNAEGRKAIERCWPKAHLTMYAKGGLWVRMREAANP
ncbi:cytochrome P450 [Schizopora paradoxa]|uniref:Cytochrome P450 n=1 Tax=Schizopora paradoxa TaxID=27342 RepID=A0A0H2RVK7_9AGAM|nr:cytochrome P450 [Schizopora paradoxa]